MTRGVLFVVLAAAALTVASASAALADDHVSAVIDASPQIDAVVVRPPDEISLSFRDPVAAVHIRVFNDGDLVASTEAVVEEALAIAQVETTGSGSYLVDWKGRDAAGAAISGSYVFTVDPRGNNSISVDREIAGASGALGGLRVIAAALSAAALAVLLGACVKWLRLARLDAAGRAVGGSALATGVASLAAAATYGVPADGSLVDLFDPGMLSSTVASWPGRAWLTAALLMGVMPFVLVLGRSTRSKWVAVGATALALTTGLWVGVGLGWLVRLPWPLMCVGLATAAGLWLAIDAGRPIAAGIALAVLLAVAVPVVATTRGSGTSSVVQAGDLLVDVSIDPARSGVNELHVYGFDVSDRAAALESVSVAAYHQTMDVGPLPLPVLRAGPNHFLSYRAILPLSGDWTINVKLATPNGGGEVAAVEAFLR